ncbi:MAG: phosphoribosylaminoimidazolesuccinocarboxamide synthase [Kiritimatiellae bacterium]|nr:phosphoribosylaminoimidazolesuccinocarboxamide synthase [Kiritimatiellia bacterium]
MDRAYTIIDIPELRRVKSGKVREMFDLGECWLLVATDRISAFDCVLPTGIPAKGHVLNLMSAFWFRHLADVVPNHCVSVRFGDLPSVLQEYRGLLRGRTMIVRKADVLPVECIVRGYLAGSGWKEYQATGAIGGMPLRAGYRLADRLDEPLFTPSTKAAAGHDVNITLEETAKLIGAELAARVRDISLELYRRAAAWAAERGIIIADTKFEFGLIDGQLHLVDEVLTPDSSRFWPADRYEPGRNPPSFDKQYVRDYLESLPWNKTPPAPELPAEVVERTRVKYIEAFQRITGRALSAAIADA